MSRNHKKNLKKYKIVEASYSQYSTAKTVFPAEIFLSI